MKLYNLLGFYHGTFIVRGHLRAKNLRNLVGNDFFNRAFKFAIVRNPWDWEVSHYFWVLNQKKHQYLEQYKGVGSFEQYIESGLFKISHGSQSGFIVDEGGNVIVDFVGKVENLQKDLKEICDRIGIGIMEIPYLNKSKHRPYQEYYNEKTREIVAKCSKEDIERFGYDFA